MIIDFNRLSTFVTVAQYDSVTKAAAALHLTQQAVSSQIQHLEQDLGVLLFKRANRRVYLTKQGQQIYTHITPLLKAIEQQVIITVADVTSMEATLVIGSTNEVAEMLLTDKIAAFKKQFTHVQFELVLANDSETEEGVLNGRLDMGLVVFSKDVKLLNVQPFVAEEFVTVASGEYLKQHPKKILHIKDLLNHAIIDFEPHCPSLKTWVLKNDKKLHSHFEHTRATIAANDDRMIRRLVLANMGVANLPRSLFKHELDSGEVIEILPNSKKIKAGIDIVSLKRETTSLVAQTFMVFLLENK